MRIFLLLSVLSILGFHASFAEAAASRPNIIFIMADDQGWGDLGCYGSPAIKTPHLDRLAAQGMRFTNAYSGSAVCAPTRCVLMTGLHTGHARRRDNTASAAHEDFTGRPLVFLEKEDLTVATVLKRAGYVTGGFGKWGLGNPGSSGTPDQHGFDHFYGYLDQVHAHDYYTDELWRDGRMVPLAGNENDAQGVYSHDVIAEASREFVRTYQDRPFFLYLPYTPPHGKYVVPSDAPYTGENWSQPEKNYAAMITRLDADIGRLMDLLQELKLEEKTIVFYTSDNGPPSSFVRRFNSAGPFRGAKRDLYEGGIRCPMIVRWPGRIAAGTVNDFVWSHVDFFATAGEIAGVKAPRTDGISVLPVLLGGPAPAREFLYWEIHSPFHQAVRMGTWKGVRFGTREPLELYDLANDPGENKNLAKEHPQIVGRIEQLMAESRTETKYWPAVEKRKRAGKKKAE